MCDDAVEGLRLPAGGEGGAPLGSISQDLIDRLAHPFRFAPRQIDFGASVMLPPFQQPFGAWLPLSARIVIGARPSSRRAPKSQRAKDQRAKELKSQREEPQIQRASKSA